MANLDYKKLYKLQDKVLDLVFKNERIFYLTGGTCLNRFYKEKRYSDDLDFFTNDNQDFYRAIRGIRILFKKYFRVKEEVTSKDFIRLRIDDLLQVDFVNDRVVRYKEPIYLDNGYIIDNIENILSNKITAVISRDNAKDVFDIYLIDKFYKINWIEILKISQKKTVFDNNELIIRLKTFPISLLNNISLVDEKFLDNFEDEFKITVEKIEKAANTF
jgi:predicted nucleotidyltransferase component of viral defense system